MPFPYFHLLNVILISQLLLLAYTLATTAAVHPAISIPVMAFISIVLLGLCSLSIVLSNPFGTDSVDFDCEAFLMAAFGNARAHLCAAEHEACATALPSGMENPLEIEISDGTRGARGSGGDALNRPRSKDSNRHSSATSAKLWGETPGRVCHGHWPGKATMPTVSAPPQSADDVYVDIDDSTSTSSPQFVTPGQGESGLDGRAEHGEHRAGRKLASTHDESEGPDGAGTFRDAGVPSDNMSDNESLGSMSPSTIGLVTPMVSSREPLTDLRAERSNQEARQIM